MFFTKGGIIAAALFFRGLVAADNNSTLLIPPPSGQIIPNPTATSVNLNATHALGGLPIASATFTAIPFIVPDWSVIIQSNFSGPPTLANISPNVTFANATAANATSFETINILPPHHLRKRALPSIVDWRNRWGINWITTVQDQGQCGSCWAFAASALMETMVRIQHGMWSKRSEGDLHDSLGVSCDQGGSAESAVEWVGGGGAGIADPNCYKYYADNDHYYPCGDRSGRALRVPSSNVFAASSKLSDQKQWISNVGPITASFDVYTDFDSWTPSQGVYKYDGKSTFRGRHVCLVVGYDDNRGCWIVKNSWGTWWGDKGYIYIGYGQIRIDEASKMGLTNPNPDAWTRRRHHNGNMYQSGNGGTHRNLELVRSLGVAGIRHVWRAGGEGGDWSWHSAELLLGKDGNGNAISGYDVIGHPLITGTSFNRNFEIFYWEKGGYLHGWYFNQLNNQWYDTGVQGNGQVAGYPGFTQRYDSVFAITSRMTDGTMWEWSRALGTDGLAFEAVIAKGVMQSGPSLVASNIGSLGNLYVVAVMNTGEMQLYWRDPSTSVGWLAGEAFGSNVGSTPPVMIQSYWHTDSELSAGSFQLCVAVNGQVQHWQRVNEDITINPPMAGVQGRWQHLFTFGSNVQHVWSLVHGSFNQALEMVVEDYEENMIHWHYTNAGWKPTAIIPK